MYSSRNSLLTEIFVFTYKVYLSDEIDNRIIERNAKDFFISVQTIVIYLDLRADFYMLYRYCYHKLKPLIYFKKYKTFKQQPPIPPGGGQKHIKSTKKSPSGGFGGLPF